MSVDKGMISDAELAAIKARQQYYRLSEVRLMSDGHNSVFIHATEDVARLVAEVERLRQEIQGDDVIIDDLRCAGAKLEAETQRLQRELNLAGDEIHRLADRLRESNQRRRVGEDNEIAPL